MILKNTDPKKRIHVTTLGCSKNVYDSEILMGQLLANDMHLTKNPEDADILIVNTCGFITPAKRESIQAILEAGKLKGTQKSTQLIVCGCLSSRYQKELTEKIPEVDRFFGTEDYISILKYLNLEVQSDNHLYEKRFLSEKPHFAYLKISEGCNHKCAFCAIPLMRGKHRSRTMEDITHEAELLAKKGVKEIILVAQDTTFYGIDLYKKQRIIDLLKNLENITGIEWIRLHYAYPTTIQSGLLDIIAGSSKIVSYIDLPIQHISDPMLKIMKRGGSSNRIRGLLSEIRNRIPEVAIRTSLIVGHPGETDDDYTILKDFVQEFQFDRLGVFSYSPEENTTAYELSHPPETVTRKRFNEIMNIQKHISLKKNKEHIGKIYRVIIDEFNPSTSVAIARTYADSPEIDNEVIIENISSNFKPGSFQMVKINDAAEYELFGALLEE